MSDNSWWKNTTKSTKKMSNKNVMKGLRTIYDRTIRNAGPESITYMIQYYPLLEIDPLGSLIEINNLVGVAANSTHPKYRHAALVFIDGQLVGYANNKGNSHAEYRAIEVAKLHGYGRKYPYFNNHNIILLSIRITKGGKLALAKPCIKCQRLCQKLGIKNILYSTNNHTIVRMK